MFWLLTLIPLVFQEPHFGVIAFLREIPVEFLFCFDVSWNYVTFHFFIPPSSPFLLVSFAGAFSLSFPFFLNRNLLHTNRLQA